MVEPTPQASKPRLRLVLALPLAGVLLCTLGGIQASAQSPVEVLEPKASFQSFPTQEFIPLYGDRAAVGYMPGGLDRADHLLQRLDNLANFFRRWRSDLPIPLTAYAVDRVQWKKIGLPGLYGLPLRTGPSSVFIPASGDEEAVRMWRSALGVQMLPMVPGVPVTGTPEQAATLALSDVLLQLEASRGFAVAADLRGTDAWVQEVAAHVAALVAFRKTEPQRMTELNDLFARLRHRMGGPRRHDAEHFSQDLQRGEELEVKAWLWYQGVFFSAAEAIVKKDGNKAVQRLLRLRETNGRALGTGALLKRYPALRAWRAEWFRAPTGVVGISPASAP